MTDEHAQMEKLLEVEAAPVVPALHPMRWIHENLFRSVISGVLTVITILALLGFAYGVLSWIFAPQRALVPEGVTTIDGFVTDLLLDDLSRVDRVEPDQAVEPGEMLRISTTDIEWEVPQGVGTVAEFAEYLLTTHSAAGFVPTGEAVAGGGEPQLERVDGLDPADYLTTADDVISLNHLQPGQALVPGETYRVEGSVRHWDAIATNSRNYATLAYPANRYVRVWISFGMVCALAGMSLAAWSLRPKVSSAGLAKRVTIFGLLLAGIAVLAPWSFVPDIITILVATGAAVGAFFVRRLLLRRNDGDRQDLSLMGLLSVLMAVIIGLMWLLPEVIAKMQIADTTKIPFTVMALVGVAAYWVGRFVKDRLASDRALKGSLVGLWLLSLPLIYLVILRDPEMVPEGTSAWSALHGSLFIAVMIAILGAALLWFMSGRNAGEAGKALAGLLVVIGILVWLPFDIFTIGAVLMVATVLGVLLLRSEMNVERGLVFVALLVGTALVWGFIQISHVPDGSGVEKLVIENPGLNRIMTKLLLGGLASIGLAASTFGGSSRARKSLVAAWVVTAGLVAWFSMVVEAPTSLSLESDPLGGLNLTLLLAVGGILLSFPVGVLLALGRTSTMPLFRLMSTSYIETVRGVPLITVLFFGALFLPLFLPQDLRIHPALKALIAITGFSGAYLAENVRGGLQSIPTGQYEASRALGMSTVQMTIFIILPQALRAVIPALVGQVIALFKDTSLVTIVGLADLLHVARSIVPGQPAFIGSQLENLAFVAVVYWMFTFSFSRASLRIERKLGLGER